MHPFKAARRVDDAVLGRPDTTRGFVGNMLLGLHPVMAPVWMVLTIACAIAVIWQLAAGDALKAVAPAMLGMVSVASAIASRRAGLPR